MNRYESAYRSEITARLLSQYREALRTGAPSQRLLDRLRAYGIGESELGQTETAKSAPIDGQIIMLDAALDAVSNDKPTVVHTPKKTDISLF
jgi:hypothetical protein